MLCGHFLPQRPCHLKWQGYTHFPVLPWGQTDEPGGQGTHGRPTLSFSQPTAPSWDSHRQHSIEDRLLGRAPRSQTSVCWVTSANCYPRWPSDSPSDQGKSSLQPLAWLEMCKRSTPPHPKPLNSSLGEDQVATSPKLISSGWF